MCINQVHLYGDKGFQIQKMVVIQEDEGGTGKSLYTGTVLYIGMVLYTETLVSH